MRPGALAFYSVLIGTELFIVCTFGLIFDKQTFYSLATFSLVMTFVLGIFGALRMKGDPLYYYREAYDHDMHRFNEE